MRRSTLWRDGIDCVSNSKTYVKSVGGSGLGPRWNHTSNKKLHSRGYLVWHQALCVFFLCGFRKLSDVASLMRSFYLSIAWQNCLRRFIPGKHCVLGMDAKQRQEPIYPPPLPLPKTPQNSCTKHFTRIHLTQSWAKHKHVFDLFEVVLNDQVSGLVYETQRLSEETTER